jgi:hypothetical protein
LRGQLIVILEEDQPFATCKAEQIRYISPLAQPPGIPDVSYRQSNIQVVNDLPGFVARGVIAYHDFRGRVLLRDARAEGLQELAGAVAGGDAN